MRTQGPNAHRVCRLLVERGADINSKDDKGFTPLHWSAKTGGKDVVQFLISRGAEINAVDNSGTTALQMAKDQGHKDVVNVLLANGAKQ